MMILNKRRLALLAAAVLCLFPSSYSHANSLPLSGQQLYDQCIACHTFGYSRTGPDHCGLFGRAAGSLEGFEFTQAMRDSNIIWTEQSLDDFLSAPLRKVPGTSMGFIGINDPEQRRHLILFIQDKANSDDCN